MARRRNGTAAVVDGTWVIVGQDNSRLRVTKWGKGATLAHAQTITLDAPEGTVLYVEQYHDVGAPTRLYRVERGERSVTTTILNDAD